MKIYSLGKKVPVIAKDAKIFVGAIIIGDVFIGKEVNIWPGAVLRGDLDKIAIGENCNIQENCTIHIDKGYPVVLEKNITIGHNSVIHGCRIERNVIVGMNSTILNGAHIPNNCIVGANSLVTPKSKLEEGTLIIGTPAKSIRKLSDVELRQIETNWKEYIKISERYMSELKEEII